MDTVNSSNPLDSMIAQLNIMTTDFIFSKHQCRHRVIAIADKLQSICQHPELAFFPDQQIVYFKMLKVWKALAFDAANTEHEEQAQKTEHLRSVPMH